MRGPPCSCTQGTAPYLSQVAQLRHGDSGVRAKALLAARELLCTPAQHVQCIAAGMSPALVELLQVNSDTVSPLRRGFGGSGVVGHARTHMHRGQATEQAAQEATFRGLDGVGRTIRPT
jgi:hypothetical protein